MFSYARHTLKVLRKYAYPAPQLTTNSSGLSTLTH
jgi:hypothetical protein